MQKARAMRTAGVSPDRDAIEVDTSSARVPIGFVRAASAVLMPGEQPDTFWSSCLASDGTLDLRSAVVEAEDNPALDRVIHGMHDDLGRVQAQGIIALPGDVRESFALHGCCQSCCGSVLLVRTDSRAYYIHWHRES